MAITEIPTVVPKAILDALGLTVDATRDEIIGAATKLASTSASKLTSGESTQLAALQKAVGLVSGATVTDIVAALSKLIPTAAEPATGFMARVAVAMGMPANAPAEAVRTHAQAIGTRLRIERAIGERRVHRAQRSELFALASKDYAAFDAVVSCTAVIGYSSASDELNALVEARRQARAKDIAEKTALLTRTRERLNSARGTGTFGDVQALESEVVKLTGEIHGDPLAFAFDQVGREAPELVHQVDDERRGRINDADVVRFNASQDLAARVAVFTAEGKTWTEAIELVAADEPQLVRAYSAGIEPA